MPARNDRAIELQRRRRERANVLRTFPEEHEGQEALIKLQELSSEALARLVEYGEDEIRSIVQGEFIGLVLDDETPNPNEELFTSGLLVKARVEEGPGQTSLVGKLSDKGRIAARILLAVGEIPPWAADHLPFSGDREGGTQEPVDTPS